jgi:uroporphyrinogen-III synthase
MNPTPRIAVTLSAGALAGLVEALTPHGAQIEEVPLLRFLPPLGWDEVDRMLARLGEYPTLALTSPRAATVLMQRLPLTGNPLPVLPTVWAAGSATAAPLELRFPDVRFAPAAPESSLGAGARLAEAMLAAAVTGPVLFLCGDTRRDDLPARLRRGGLWVQEAVCYRSVLCTESEATAVLTGADIVVVGSPTVAQLLTKALPTEPRPTLVALGPTTAAAARAGGWTPVAVAAEPSLPGLLAALWPLLSNQPVR